MPGRIKPHYSAHAHDAPHTYQHLKPLPHLSHVRRQDVQPPAPAPPPPAPAPAPEPTQTTTSGSLFENQAPSAKSFVLNKQTIIWLVVISIIVFATLIIVACLLCRCKRRRNKDRQGGGGKRHQRLHSSLEMKDGRNEFQAWNRHAPPRASSSGQGGLEGVETWESGTSAAPLRPMPAVMEPVVVDYAQDGVGVGVGGGKQSSRYYSNLNERGSIWKRISQIGRAY